MIKLFKTFLKKETRNNAITQIANIYKSNAQVVQEIHDEFYSEVDLLLAQTKISVSEDTQLSHVIEKANRLRLLGFGDTKECKEAEIEEKRLSEAKALNAKKNSLAEAIKYFCQKYPQYKFITEKSVKKICAKYNLIYGPSNKYSGTVPDKNLKQIETFKIDPNDRCWQKTLRNRFAGWGDDRLSPNICYFSEKQKVEEYLKFHGNNGVIGFHETEWAMDNSSSAIGSTPCLLEIAAPITDFNTENMELSNFKLTEIIVYDPVVLHPVFFEGQKHYLIVTAWGAEASDELIVNQKMN